MRLKIVTREDQITLTNYEDTKRSQFNLSQSSLSWPLDRWNDEIKSRLQPFFGEEIAGYEDAIIDIMWTVRSLPDLEIDIRVATQPWPKTCDCHKD